YWLPKDRRGGFPHELHGALAQAGWLGIPLPGKNSGARAWVSQGVPAQHGALAQAGWLGIAMPEKYGGAGLGITEAVLMMQAIAESGAAMSGASAVHINIFGLQPVVVFGTAAQKTRI